MAGVTYWVRKTLNKLGWDASDSEVKAYIRANAPEIPENYIGLTLRRLRGKVVPARAKQPPMKSKKAEQVTAADGSRDGDSS